VIGPQDLAQQFGYEAEYMPFNEEGLDLDTAIQTIIARTKAEIRLGRPALVWNAFTTAEWDVVCGFDNEKKLFYGRGSYLGLEEYASADEKHTGTFRPALGAIFIGNKGGTFDSPSAEINALQEAVRHAHSTRNQDKLSGSEWVFLEGFQAYERWVNDFKNPNKPRSSGDAYCYGIFRSTHKAAADFLVELAPKYPSAQSHLLAASRHFSSEVETLNQGENLLWWDSPEGPDALRNEKVSEVLGRAYASYKNGIGMIEKALEALEE
jgi:hypothetical protein